MKKLLLILCLAFIGCSKDEPEEPVVVEAKYFALLTSKCGSGDGVEVEIPDYTYKAFLKKDLPDCEIEYELPKIVDGKVDGWNKGYVLAISVDD